MTQLKSLVICLIMLGMVGSSLACTMICGDYWVGVVIHVHPDLYSTSNGGLFKDQCFRYTGHHTSHQGYTWKEIHYGSDLGWVASEYTYSKAC
ncbi:hypothetical protein ACF0H5_004792 [Mactra antiquata]